MFQIRIAHLTIGIENKYDYVRRLCREYETDTGTPDFSVSVSEQEIAREQRGAAEDGGQEAFPFRTAKASVCTAVSA